MCTIYNIGIIGGGISGAVTALQLAEHGINNIVFEQENSLVNGPPFCHLHAGGNLYPDISDEQCKLLMKQSIEMARLFPQSIDKRPTLISIPKNESFNTESIEQRLKMLVKYYKELIKNDPENEILGAPENYYKKYTSKDFKALLKQPLVVKPSTSDEWIANAIKIIDYDKIKSPLFIVQEYGWNLFRVAAQIQLALQKAKNCNLELNTCVTNIKDVRDKNLNYNWELYANNKVYKVKYLVNSGGFKTGTFEKALKLNTEQIIEFKAAYISKWQTSSVLIPELIFHGERGTPHGMAQLTPYFDNYYQIHGMTKDITLFDNGLIQFKANEQQPEFKDDIKQKLNRNWPEYEVKSRTEKAIKFIANFVPSFETAILGGPPLYGAQQISGNDSSLRVGEVSFPSKSYARCEIIKASSALSVANKILKKVQEENISPALNPISNKSSLLDSVSKNEIDKMAKELAIQRGYPAELSELLIKTK